MVADSIPHDKPKPGAPRIMQISIDTAVDSESDIRAAAVMLGTFLFERNKKPGDFPFQPAAAADQWTPEQIAAARASNAQPMVLPVIPPPPPPPPPPVDAPVNPSVFAVPPPPSLAVSGTDVPAPPAIPNTAITPPSAPPTASPSELDATGLPWDKRIHSDPPKRNADGSWRTRRNLADDVKSAVTSELRMSYPQAAPAAPVVVPPPPVPLPSAPAAVVPPPPPAQVIPPAPPAAAGTVSASQPVGVQPGAAQVAVSDFKSLMAKAGALMQAGKLTHPQLAQACVACGVASLPALMSAPEKIPAVNAWLDANVPQ
jgi:hypothetical protein